MIVWILKIAEISSPCLCALMFIYLPCGKPAGAEIQYTTASKTARLSRCCTK